jgi:hypothetical protein
VTIAHFRRKRDIGTRLLPPEPKLLRLLLLLLLPNAMLLLLGLEFVVLFGLLGDELLNTFTFASWDRDGDSWIPVDVDDTGAWALLAAVADADEDEDEDDEADDEARTL